MTNAAPQRRGILPGERLSGRVWGHRGAGDKQLLKQLVHRLRQKLEPDPVAPEYLVTEPGLGYRLRPSGPDEDGSKSG